MEYSAFEAGQHVISLFFFLFKQHQIITLLNLKNTSLNDNIYRKCVRTAFLHRDKL